jgi:hypothetical protein
MSRDKAVRYDQRRYGRHNRIASMFGCVMGWCRTATR